MVDEIELSAKNDHDLLVMAVMQGNETVRHLEKMNNSVAANTKAIATNVDTINNLACRKGTIFGCISRRKFISVILILVVLLSGGTAGASRIMTYLPQAFQILLGSP